jgi:hypothetical protein
MDRPYYRVGLEASCKMNLYGMMIFWPKARV